MHVCLVDGKNYVDDRYGVNDHDNNDKYKNISCKRLLHAFGKVTQK